MKTLHQPLQTKDRVVILDFLRGIALLGIFMVNLPLMNAPFVTEMGAFAIWTDSVNSSFYAVLKFFFTGKFYTLFSMLFGIGFYFFMRKAEESAAILPLFRRRLAWLLLIGILHVTLLWYGDILVFYALLGFIMILYRKKSNRTLLVWAFVLLLIPVIVSALFVGLVQIGLNTPESADQIREGFIAQQHTMQDMLQRAMVVYSSGTFGEIVRMRLEEYSNILGGILFFYPNVLAMFLVGMVLARKKVFENLGANTIFFKRLLVYCLPVALIGNFMYVYFGSKASFIDINWNLTLSLIGSGFGGPALTFVYISIACHIMYKGLVQRIVRAISLTGRMALTNYLMQSLIATTIFFSYGLGLYGQVNIWQGMVLVILIYILQVVYSNIWLKFYMYGPMEWLWRTLTYGKKQPMRRQKQQFSSDQQISGKQITV